MNTPRVVKVIVLVLCSALTLVGSPTSYSVGPNFTASGTFDTGSGSGWFSPGNITAEDGSVAATGLIRTDTYSGYLRGTDLRFSIPSSATINGIKLEIKVMDASDQDGTGICSDSQVSLVKGGTIQGANRAGHGLSTSSLTWEVYGGSSDLWGLTWTPSDLNSSAFGAVLQVHLIGSSGINFAKCIVDAYRITVYYTN